jgi:phenylalanyl-tRNA synthetase beta chain
VIGEVHPLVAETFGIDAQCSIFEIDVSELDHGDVMPLYRDVITYPAVRQDIAVVVDADLAAATLLDEIRAAGGELLAAADVFDVYRGPQVGDGRQSIAVHLQFQAPDRTLTDAEADAVRARIVDALAERVGAELRG